MYWEDLDKLFILDQWLIKSMDNQIVGLNVGSNVGPNVGSGVGFDAGLDVISGF